MNINEMALTLASALAKLGVSNVILPTHGCNGDDKNDLTIRMHSSRMCTTCLLPISPSMHCSQGGACPRGCTFPGGVPAQGGVPAWGGYLPRGMYLPGVYLPRYSPCEQNS